MHACFVVAFSLLFASATSLQCYLGYALLRGSTIGNGTKTCGRDSDYCYYASASIFSLTTFQKAGCNSLICQFIPPQRCFKQSFFGMPVNFCCCRDKDLCNGEDMTRILSE
ncbi:hypothetical protein RB195_006309 [Necator americanus]|uniref:ET module n=1 Tax=Necator americanus TaxID=51031 RepID=A0ABR1BUZ1_NECAM